MVGISFEDLNILLLIKCRPPLCVTDRQLTGNIKPSCAGIALGMALGNSKNICCFPFVNTELRSAPVCSIPCCLGGMQAPHELRELGDAK